ncbi:MAG: CocE/NonD family hydrolase [Rhodobacteraceae bacterium]|nr:CocE/NonD family hydrolase [Paracoccaceae bacterium]
MAVSGDPAPHGVVIARSVKVPARDGVMLSVDIYRPARDGEALPGPFPAIVTRSPYDTRSGKGPSGQAGNGEYFARRGYLYVVQDVRGRFESGGDFELLSAHEGPDGYDVIEWLAARPWCNGMIGTQGSSLRAWNQNATALLRPPHLRAMWINQGGSNGFMHALRHHGALELRWLAWLVTNSTHAQEAHADPRLQAGQVRNAETMFAWLRKLPWSEGESPLAALPKWEARALGFYRNAEYGEYWKNPTLNFEIYRDRTADIPTVYSGAWYDSYPRATIRNFTDLAGRLGHQYLIMGAGVHGGPNLDNPMAGDVDMGPKAPVRGNLARDRHALMLEFFDRFLKGDETAWAGQPAVRYFHMGGNGGRNAAGKLVHGGEWRQSPVWPPAGVAPQDWFLHAGGRLAPVPPEEGAPTRYASDPERPMPTVAATVSSLTQNLPPFPRMMRTGDPISLRESIVLQGAADQVTHAGVRGAEPPFGDLAARPDVVTFTTAPFAEDFDLTGAPEVEIHLSSDAPDTDLFCMLQDLYPESETWPAGYRMNLSESIFRVRYREGFERPVFLSTGVPVRVRFELYPTSNRFRAGHRLRLLISSSSFPRFDVNPNTGEPVGRHTHLRKAVNAVHHDPAHPSRLILPVWGAAG